MEEPDRPRSDAEKERTTALAKVKAGDRGVLIEAMDDLKEFAETAVKAGTAPKGMGVGAAMMAIQAGLERGMRPLGGLQAAVVINGVLSWRGWAATAMLQQSGLVVSGTFRSWVDGELDGREANAVGYASAQRVGYKEPFVRTFSVSDAKKAGLWGKTGPWQTRPGNMLEWRALGDLVRFHFPEVMGGIPIAEDVEAGGIGPTVTVEDPQERASRPAPKVVDPILAEVTAGDKSGIVDAEVAETEEDRQKNIEEAAEEERREEAPKPDSPPAPAEAPTRDEGGDREPPAPTPAPEGKATTKDKIDPCPRCGEEDGGYAMFGECGVCQYPEDEPGTVG